MTEMGTNFLSSLGDLLLLAYIHIYFLRNCSSVFHSLKKVEPLDLGPSYLFMYIAHISVSKPSPWAVAGPHGQLASESIVAIWSARLCPSKWALSSLIELKLICWL